MRKLAIVLLAIFLFRALLLPAAALAYDPTGMGGSYILPGGNLSPTAPVSGAMNIGNFLMTKINFENAVFKTNEMNLESFVWSVLHALGQSIITMIFGCISCHAGMGRGPTGGVLPFIAMAIDGIYQTKPASGIQWLADIGSRLNLVSPVYAQGVGYQRMMMFQPLWTAFRNITYVFFVLIIIFIGFSIMFRMKISPQAVITIQSALPRIVLGLILITFSYAIVGFLIDIMWIVNNLILAVFASLPVFTSPIPGTNIMVISNPLRVAFTSGPIFVAIITLAGAIPATIGFLMTVLTLGAVVGTIMAIAGLATGGTGVMPAFLISGVGAALIIILLGIVFILAYIRMLWTLLKAYVGVVLSLIFAPFQILIGTLPGSDAIGTWLRNLIANLAVLPTVLAMVLIAAYITIRAFTAVPDQVSRIISSLLSGNITQAISGFTSLALNQSIATMMVDSLIMVFLSLGILLMTPKAADLVQAFLAGKPFAYGTAIGEAVSGPPKVATQLFFSAKPISEAYPHAKKFVEGIGRLVGI